MDSFTLQHRRLPRRFLHIFSIFIILALAFPSTGAATPNQPTANPHIVASLTGDWFEALEFAPETLVHIDIFDASAVLLWEADRLTDTSGSVHIGSWEHPVDLVPGVEIFMDDGTTTKSLELEGVTLDVFDTDNDILSGYAPPPYGRAVWVGTGHEGGGCSADLTSDPVTGAWAVDFSLQLPPCDVTDDMWAAAQVFDLDGDASEANPLPNPSFVIFPVWNLFDGNGWPTGATVNISVVGKPQCTTSRESFRYFFNGSFPEGCDVVIGDIVTFTNGATTRTHTVRVLEVTGVDLVNDTVSGIASPGAEVDVWPHATGQKLVVDAGFDGSWQADFGGIFDIVAGEFGRAAIWDAQGNATQVEWGLPSPHMVIFPEAEFFDGLDWPDGPVEITVAGKLVCSLTKESVGGFFNGNFPEGCDVVTGDTVSFSDGVTVRTHIVQYLDVTDLDLLNDEVSGVATPGAEVHVWPHATGQELVVTADLDTSWHADFTGMFDIVPGEYGRSAIWDSQGNATAVDWGIPSPYFKVFPETDWFDGLNWPDGALVEISVVGKPECSLVIESWDYFFNGYFPEGCDLVVGDVVDFLDGSIARYHTVRQLAYTEVDINTETVDGTAEPGATVYVWAWDVGNEVAVDVEGGRWEVDFGALGIDLLPGMGIRAEIRDEQNNATTVDYWIPNPHIVASLTWDWFEALEFPPDSPVEVKILASPGGAVLWEAERTTDASGYIFVGSWEHPVDLVPGITISFDEATVNKELTLEDVTMDTFDVDDDFLAGTAPPPFARRVWVGTGNDSGGCSADLTSDPVTGAWEVDFSLAQPPCDVTADMWGAAQVFDADGDATEVNPTPTPTMVIFPEWEFFDGHGWPTGAPVAISVAGKPACTTTADSARYFFNGNFPEGCNIVFGDVVTFTNGATTTSHTVRALAVSRVDKPGDSVAGTATAGAEVHVWPHDGPEVLVTADAGGDWLADFGGLFDITAGQAGRAEIRDAQGNSTAVDWLAFYDLCLPVIFNP